MRQIILDTETTGLDPERGHKIIEIGCVEIRDRKLTGATFHSYLNPERAVDDGAFRVHGISTDFLKDKPLFKDQLHDFLEFIKGAELVIHNAPFDVGFLNAELRHVRWNNKLEDYCPIVDSLVLARKKHPGQRNTLDALCKRYNVNNSNRQLHGALLDAELLGLVYLAMTGGQTSLFHEEESSSSTSNLMAVQQHDVLHSKNPVIITASPEELKQHQAMLEMLKKSNAPAYFEDVNDI